MRRLMAVLLITPFLALPAVAQQGSAAPVTDAVKGIRLGIWAMHTEHLATHGGRSYITSSIWPLLAQSVIAAAKGGR